MIKIQYNKYPTFGCNNGQVLILEYDHFTNPIVSYLPTQNKIFLIK